MKILVEITDQDTGKTVVARLSMHDAQNLYKALREVVGDAQYQAQPGELITVPDARITL